MIIMAAEAAAAAATTTKCRRRRITEDHCPGGDTGRRLARGGAGEAWGTISANCQNIDSDSCRYIDSWRCLARGPGWWGRRRRGARILTVGDAECLHFYRW